MKKDKICFSLYDEYDHCNTIRMDNPFKITALEGNKILNSLFDVDTKIEKERKLGLCNC